MKRSVVGTLSCAAVLIMLAASTLHTPALAGQLEGATLADTLQAGEKTLKLNGLGLRKKAMLKVYVGGLYLESPSKDAGAILASDQAKAIRMHFLRDLTKAQLVGLRFADDAELPALVDRAVRERLSKKDIKRAIKSWVPDRDRT